ncbi:MAG TPA: DUF1573 domain-containing protein [Urbifossiella sp.]|jgi:hypothetical protein|nr:DUF1573 domain-containing protein [Urbifossiella sp.]
MQRTLWIAAAALALTAPAHAQPAPAAQPAQAAQTAPWANKFFLPDIAKHRDQTPPALIQHNFGDVAHGTLCSHTFTITNIYDVPMQITDVRMSCSCLGYTPMAKVLQPNATGEFTITMNSGKFVGANSQTFYVTFGPKYISTAVIRVAANSKTDVTVNPGAVIFGIVPQGTKASQSVKVEYKGRSRDWKIVEAMAANSLDVGVTETSRGGVLRGGAEYLLTVSLKRNLRPGPIAEQVALKTNDPGHPLIQVMVTGTIAPPLEVAPARVRMDSVAIGQSRLQRVLLRASKPFKVLGVDGIGEGVTVELPTTARTALPVQVITVKFDRKKPTALDRDLRVKTDLDGGATVTVPVEAEAIK